MIPINKNQILVERLCAHIEPLLDKVVLVGGCAVGFLITDTAQLLIRETNDVDLATEIMTQPDYYAFGEDLRKLGFAEDVESGVICRWLKDELRLDIMPLDANVLGFTNSWYPNAFKTAVSVNLPNGKILKHIDGPTFIATKLEAFLHRGGGDFSHHDIEDIITVINGRSELLKEIQHADIELKTYLEEELGTFLELTAFTNYIPGHLRPNQNRTETVIERLRRITSN